MAEVANRVGEAVEVSAGGIRGAEIWWEAVSEDDEAEIAHDEPVGLLELLGANLHRRASEVEIQLVFYLDGYDEQSHGTRWEKGPVICLQSGGVATTSAL